MRDTTTDPSARRDLAELSAALTMGRSSVDWGALDGIRYTVDDAHQIIEAAQAGAQDVMLRGQLMGSLRVTRPLGGDLVIAGEVHGSLLVLDSVAGSLAMRGDAIVHGDVQVRADVSGGIDLGGRARVEGRVEVEEATLDRLSLHGRAWAAAIAVSDGTMREGLWLESRASVGGPVDVFGSSSIGGIIAADKTTIGGRLLVSGGSSAGDIYIGRDARVVGDLDLVSAASAGEVEVAGQVEGVVRVGGDLSGRLNVTGVVGGVDLSSGSFDGDVSLAPKGVTTMPVLSVERARFARPVHLGEKVSIVPCDFRRCGDLDKLDLVGADLFTLPDGARAKELTKPDGASDGEMGSIYRQLRVNLEGKGNRPASAFFYRGEMDARRRAAWDDRRWGEWGWISLYRWIAGYGLRVAPPLVWFVLLIGLGGVAFHGLGLELSWPETFVFTAHSMLSLFRPPEIEGEWAIGALQIVLRLLGPVLLGLAAFAVRDKVAR